MLKQSSWIMMLFLFTLGLSFHPRGGWTADLPAQTEICSHVIIVGEFSPPLSATEKRLICGGKVEEDKPSTQAWSTIPFSQFKFHFKNFLQARGYHHPTFHQDSPQNPNIIVDIGHVTRVTQVRVEGAHDSEVEIGRKRDLIGKVMSPPFLTELEKWVTGQLQSKGYGCPYVRCLGDPMNGHVLITIQPGEKQDVVSIETEDIPGMNANALRRYDAFNLHQQFDSTLLSVTENRILQSRIVESTHFSIRCSPQGVHLKQDVVPGRPRLLSAGLGINTEGYVLFKARWENSRMGLMGSSMGLNVYQSARYQAFSASAKWYFLPEVSRTYLNPLIEVFRQNETPFETLTFRTQVGLATTREFLKSGVTIFLGPSLDFYRTIRGVGAARSEILSLENRIAFRTHAFEFYAAQAQQGLTANFTADLNAKGVASDVTAERFNLSGQILFNYKNYDPPLWILGIRTSLSTILTPESNQPGTLIPGNLLQYLGGSTDLRGFGRKELPLDQKGGLTSVYFGAEARLSHEFPFNVDPFVFIDFGKLGSNPVNLDSDLFWSPGIGLRWASFVGPFRITLAHGFTGSVPNHFQVFFSFGEEF